ncbi:hypothetical protein Tco_0472649 [Tanacetum coccineum]
MCGSVPSVVADLNTIWLVQNGYSFYGLQSEDPNQHLKDFLKLVDSFDLNSDNRERTRMRLSEFPLRDQARNWLERLPAGYISTWDDLTTCFLAYIFLTGRDLLKIVLNPLCFIDFFGVSQSGRYFTSIGDIVCRFIATEIPRRTIDHSAGECVEVDTSRLSGVWISLSCQRQSSSGVPGGKGCVPDGPHDTQYCMKNPEKAFINYASLRTDEAGGKWYTFKPWQNNLGDTYNSSWKIHPNLRLSKFEANFKQQQSKMANKIDTVLKAITDRITGALPSDTVKNPNLNVKSTSPVLSVCSYPLEDPQCSSCIHSLINAITICPKQPNKSCDDKSEEEEEEKGNPENLQQ